MANGNDLSSLNGLFKAAYADKIKDMFMEEKWVRDTKIARRMYHDQIQDEKEGWIRINDVEGIESLLMARIGRK